MAAWRIGTSAPVVIKDKVFVGLGGAEYGVRGHLSAYNIKDGSLAWRAYSTGPDLETLLDPQKTTHLGKPIGKDTGLNSWEGEQWKIGGGTTWGWYSYDPVNPRSTTVPAIPGLGTRSNDQATIAGR